MQSPDTKNHMSDKQLRSDMIRLAYSNPELRPVLLPLIEQQDPTKRASLQKQARNGIQYIPDDAIAFGFEGPNAETDAEELGDTLRRMNDMVRKVSHAMFKSLAIRLRRSQSDADPAYARATMVLSVQDMYANLSGEADRYFRTLPAKPYKG